LLLWQEVSMAEYSQRYKIFKLMELSPVIRNGGEKTVMIQFAYKDEIEPAIIISRWDFQRMTMLLLEALATFDDDLATEALLKFRDRGVRGPEWKETGDPLAPPFPPRTKGRRKK
jgi:hypothetical protein